MKNIYKISAVFFVGLSIIVSSCKKEELIIEGCTDSSAMNYLSNATSNDGSCIFSHEIMVNTWNISRLLIIIMHNNSIISRVRVRQLP